MANTISALKANKQGEKRRLRNRAVKSALHTQTRKVLAAVERKDADASRKALAAAYRLLDRAAVKGVIHRNSADRRKARLAAHVNAVGAAAAPPPPKA